jgi:hypothetical protein
VLAGVKGRRACLLFGTSTWVLDMPLWKTVPF